MAEMECCIKGCDRRAECGGMCVNHWRMLKKHGNPISKRPLAAQNRGLTIEDRFWKSVRKGANCWEWTAGLDRDGYGHFQATIHGVQTQKAHRFSYMLATGEILSPTQFVMHACDNPRCVNPDHLSAGTPAENTADMVRKGRHLAGARIRDAKNSKITDAQVLAILRDPRNYAEIANDYGISKSHVMELKSRISRRSAQIDPAEIVRAKGGSRGAKRSKNLTDDDVRLIRVSDAPGKVLAERYGISVQTVCDIQKRRSWRHVDDLPSKAPAETAASGSN